MAVLGGIVSAHAPTERLGKCIYGSAFIVLGAVGMRLVIQQSNETERADQDYKDTLKSIASSTAETKRVEQLNTTLQERLLMSTATLAELSKLGIDTSTGGNSWAYLKLLPENSSGQANLVVLHAGLYPLADLSVTIKNSDNPGTIEKPLLDASIGTLPVNGARPIGSLVLPNIREKRYVAAFVARNGSWDQLILMRRLEKVWYFATVVQQNPGQVRFAQLKHLPGPPIHRMSDPGFPGDMSETMWKTTFSGQFVFCSDCGH